MLPCPAAIPSLLPPRARPALSAGDHAPQRSPRNRPEVDLLQHLAERLGRIASARGAGRARLELFAEPIELALPLTSLRVHGAGGGTDLLARPWAEALGKAFNQQFVIENRGGAGGTIGLAQFVTSKQGQGNALLVGGLVMVGAILLNKSPVSLKQATPIARITEETQIMVVPANSPIKSTSARRAS